MKIVLLNTAEQKGGAAIVAKRLTQVLRDTGVDATLIVRDRQSADTPWIKTIPRPWKHKWNFLWERFVIFMNNGLRREPLFQVSIANTGTDITHMPEFREADLVHIHWINQGMLSLLDIDKILRSGKPVVFTMHDMWLATAICHHSYGCDNYQSQCGTCKFLASRSRNDLSTRIFNRKKQLYHRSSFEVVAVSSWLADKARQSALLAGHPFSVIPNPISLDLFVQGDKTESRRQWGVPSDRIVVAMGAARLDDPIKGLDLLCAALQYVVKERPSIAERIHLLFFGFFKNGEQQLEKFPVPYTSLGTISGADRLASIYSASDITVVPSHYESLPTTLVEAMACGSIPVAFDSGGQRDIIEHEQYGFLAEYPYTDHLGEGILWAADQLNDPNLPIQMRVYVETHFSERVVAKEYMRLYRRLVRE